MSAGALLLNQAIRDRNPGLSQLACAVALVMLTVQLLLAAWYWRSHSRLTTLSKRVIARAVARIDDPLKALLASGDIRLLRCSWLLSQEANAALARDAMGHVILKPMQQLLADAPDAFFPPHEAVELVERGNRDIFALCAAWQTTAHPDPHGWTLSAVRHFLSGPWESTSSVHIRVEERWQSWIGNMDSAALFWDYVCVAQPLRDGRRRYDEQVAFERAFEGMLPLFASAHATCVLKLSNAHVLGLDSQRCAKQIAISGLRADISEHDLRSALHAMDTKPPVSCLVKRAAREPSQPTSIFGVQPPDKGCSASAELVFDHAQDASRALSDLRSRGFDATPSCSTTPCQRHGWVLAKMVAAKVMCSHFSRAKVVSPGGRPKIIDITHADRPMEERAAMTVYDSFSNAYLALASAFFAVDDDRKLVTRLLRDLDDRLHIYSTTARNTAPTKVHEARVDHDARMRYLTHRWAGSSPRAQFVIWAALFFFVLASFLPEIFEAGGIVQQASGAVVDRRHMQAVPRLVPRQRAVAGPDFSFSLDRRQLVAADQSVSANESSTPDGAGILLIDHAAATTAHGVVCCTLLFCAFLWIRCARPFPLKFQNEAAERAVLALQAVLLVKLMGQHILEPGSPWSSLCGQGMAIGFILSALYVISMLAHHHGIYEHLMCLLARRKEEKSSSSDHPVTPPIVEHYRDAPSSEWTPTPLWIGPLPPPAPSSSNGNHAKDGLLPGEGRCRVATGRTAKLHAMLCADREELTCYASHASRERPGRQIVGGAASIQQFGKYFAPGPAASDGAAGASHCQPVAGSAAKVPAMPCADREELACHSSCASREGPGRAFGASTESIKEFGQHIAGMSDRDKRETITARMHALETRWKGVDSDCLARADKLTALHDDYMDDLHDEMLLILKDRPARRRESTRRGVRHTSSKAHAEKLIAPHADAMSDWDESPSESTVGRPGRLIVQRRLEEVISDAQKRLLAAEWLVLQAEQSRDLPTNDQEASATGAGELAVSRLHIESTPAAKFGSVRGAGMDTFREDGSSCTKDRAGRCREGGAHVHTLLAAGSEEALHRKEAPCESGHLSGEAGRAELEPGSAAASGAAYDKGVAAEQLVLEVEWLVAEAQKILTAMPVDERAESKSCQSAATKERPGLLKVRRPKLAVSPAQKLNPTQSDERAESRQCQSHATKDRPGRQKMPWQGTIDSLTAKQMVLEAQWLLMETEKSTGHGVMAAETLRERVNSALPHERWPSEAAKTHTRDGGLFDNFNDQWATATKSRPESVRGRRDFSLQACVAGLVPGAESERLPIDAAAHGKLGQDEFGACTGGSAQCDGMRPPTLMNSMAFAQKFASVRCGDSDTFREDAATFTKGYAGRHREGGACTGELRSLIQNGRHAPPGVMASCHHDVVDTLVGAEAPDVASQSASLHAGSTAERCHQRAALKEMAAQLLSSAEKMQPGSAEELFAGDVIRRRKLMRQDSFRKDALDSSTAVKDRPGRLLHSEVSSSPAARLLTTTLKTFLTSSLDDDDTRNMQAAQLAGGVMSKLPGASTLGHETDPGNAGAKPAKRGSSRFDEEEREERRAIRASERKSCAGKLAKASAAEASAEGGRERLHKTKQAMRVRKLAKRIQVKMSGGAAHEPGGLATANLASNDDLKQQRRSLVSAGAATNRESRVKARMDRVTALAARMNDEDALEELADREAETEGAGRVRNRNPSIWRLSATRSSRDRDSHGDRVRAALFGFSPVHGGLRQTKQSIVARRLAKSLMGADRDHATDLSTAPDQNAFNVSRFMTALHKASWRGPGTCHGACQQSLRSSEAISEIASVQAQKLQEEGRRAAKSKYDEDVRAAVHSTSAMASQQLVRNARESERIVVDGHVGVLLGPTRRTLYQRLLGVWPASFTVQFEHKNAPIQLCLLHRPTRGNPRAKAFMLKAHLDLLDQQYHMATLEVRENRRPGEGEGEGAVMRRTRAPCDPPPSAALACGAVSFSDASLRSLRWARCACDAHRRIERQCGLWFKWTRLRLRKTRKLMRRTAALLARRAVAHQSGGPR